MRPSHRSNCGRSARVPLLHRAAVVALVLCSVCASASAQPRKITEVRFGAVDPPVVYRKEIKEAFPVNSTAELAQTAKPIECAGMVYADGRLIIVSDRHEHCIFTMQVDLGKMIIGDPKLHKIVENEAKLFQDGESLTVLPRSDGTFAAYILCSLSNHRTEQPLPMRRHMARFTFPAGEKFVPSSAIVLDATPIRDTIGGYFEKLGIQPYRTFYNEATTKDFNTYRWANVEGITFSPDGKTVIGGFRNPLTKGATGEALLFAMVGFDDAFESEDPRRVQVTDLFSIDLKDRGVSSICWDPLTKGYLIAAAKSAGMKLDKDQPFPPNTLDSALFWWSGRKSEKPIQFASVPEMTIEAMCRIGKSRYIAFASDEGDESEGREQRQSVLTVMDFTGFK